VAIGFGFWTVGLSALAGTAITIGDNIHTKLDHYNAERKDDAMRMELLQGQLSDQEQRVWVFLASSIVSLVVGGRYLRDIEQLWSGPLAGQPETPPPPFPAASTEP
jgi:hypothetical protein